MISGGTPATAKPANRAIPDLNGRELAVLLPLVALILWLGFYPRPVLDRMEPAARGMVAAGTANRVLPELRQVLPQGGGVTMAPPR